MSFPGRNIDPERGFRQVWIRAVTREDDGTLTIKIQGQNQGKCGYRVDCR